MASIQVRKGDRLFTWCGWLGCVFQEDKQHPLGTVLHFGGELFYAFRSGSWLDLTRLLWPKREYYTQWVLIEGNSMERIRAFREKFIKEEHE